MVFERGWKGEGGKGARRKGEREREKAINSSPMFYFTNDNYNNRTRKKRNTTELISQIASYPFVCNMENKFLVFFFFYQSKTSLNLLISIKIPCPIERITFVLPYLSRFMRFFFHIPNVRDERNWTRVVLSVLEIVGLETRWNCISGEGRVKKLLGNDNLCFFKLIVFRL